MDTHTWQHTKTSWGDAAVDGLLSGVAAGVLMASFLLVTAWTAGRSWDWVLRQFDPRLVPSPLTGAATHLAVSGVYGIVFGGLWHALAGARRRVPGWLAGLVFGVLLWLLALLVTSAHSGFGGGWLQGFPAAYFAAAHIIYGLALGWLVSRFRNI